LGSGFIRTRWRPGELGAGQPSIIIRAKILIPSSASHATHTPAFAGYDDLGAFEKAGLRPGHRVDSRNVIM